MTRALQNRCLSMTPVGRPPPSRRMWGRSTFSHAHFARMAPRIRHSASLPQAHDMVRRAALRAAGWYFDRFFSNPAGALAVCGRGCHRRGRALPARRKTFTRSHIFVYSRKIPVSAWLHLLPSPSTDGARRPRDAAARHTAPGASPACQGHIPSISDSPRTPWDRYACRTRTPATSSPPPIECRLAGESRWTLAATRHSTQQLVRDLGAVRVLINERDALRRSLAQSEA